MDLGLKERVALVCGASRGIGRGCAVALAREGASVVVCAREEGPLRRAADEIRAETGAAVHPVAADLSRGEDILHLFRAAVERFGSVDILVNNAGGPPPGTFDALDDGAWGRAVEVTLLSVVRCCRAALPLMRARRFGRIVNLVSTSVKQPIETLLLSNSIRLAVVGLAKSLSREAARDGITVNCVLPGRVATDRYRDLLVAASRRAEKSLEEVTREHEEEVPVGRFAAPLEVGEAVAFLCSDRAAYINGVALAVDGGLVPFPL